MHTKYTNLKNIREFVRIRNSYQKHQVGHFGHKRDAKIRGRIEERSNFIMYYKGEIAGQRGVGFLVKPRLKKSNHWI